jgi:hypothetical protein
MTQRTVSSVGSAPVFARISCFGGNPVKYTDPDGREAWSSQNEWNENYITKYNETLISRIDQYKASGENFTCEDLALSTLIDFAQENGLPVAFSNGTGSYNSRDNKWNNGQAFKTAVLNTSGANDLMNSTMAIDPSAAGPGDMVLMDSGVPGGTKDNVMSHTSMIVMKTGYILGLRQGNTTGTRGSQYYGTRRYEGQPIEGRAYNISTDTYHNIIKGTVVSHASSSFGFQFRRWNFTGMK